MTASARTKAAKRRNRRTRNTAMRTAALKLKLPQHMGLVAAAELAVEDEAHERERRCAKATEAKRQVARQSAMDRYLARGEVTQHEYIYANRLRNDYEMSGLTSNITGSYEHSSRSANQPSPGGGPRYEEYTSAMRAVGIMLSPVLAWVAIAGLPCSQWARQFGCDPRDGMDMLHKALEALGRHYRGRM